MAETELAVEKSELHCRATTTSSFFGREPSRTWAKTGFVRLLVVGSMKRDPRAPDVATIWELMEREKTPELARRVATVVLSSNFFGRPIVGSPRIPPDRVKVLRESFMKTMNDPELLAEAEKRGMGGKAREWRKARGLGKRGDRAAPRSRQPDERSFRTLTTWG